MILTPSLPFAPRFSLLSQPEALRTARKLYDLLTSATLPSKYKEAIVSTLAPHPPELRRQIGRALAGAGVYLPSLTPDAPAVEDASARITFMYMADQPDAHHRAYLRDMIRVAEAENFQLVLRLGKGDSAQKAAERLRAEGIDRALVARRCRFVHAGLDGIDSPWEEDNKWVAGRQIAVPPKIGDNVIAAASTYAVAAEGSDRGFQGAVNMRDEQKKAHALGASLKRPTRSTRSYNEGGNMLVGARPDGRVYAVVGKDALLITTLHLLQTKAKELDPAPIEARVQELRRTRTLTQPEIDAAVKGLEALGHLKPGDGVAAKKSHAERWYAMLDLAGDVIAADLRLPREDVCFVTQPGFHIDMHLRPLGPGVVLLNDDAACVKLIDEALRAAMPAWQRQELAAMRSESLRRHEKHGARTEKIRRELEAAGLRVVSTPGVMAAPTKMGRLRAVNFMNAVPGTSPGGKQHFYATNATSITPLADGFTRFLESQGIDRVYYIGGSGGGEKSLSASEISIGEMEGGLDCLENHHEGDRAALVPSIAGT
jgi:hypothetical protein